MEKSRYKLSCEKYMTKVQFINVKEMHRKRKETERQRKTKETDRQIKMERYRQKEKKERNRGVNNKIVSIAVFCFFFLNHSENARQRKN